MEIPVDAIEIDADEYHRLLEGQQNGLEITPGADGSPVLTEPVIDYVAPTAGEKLASPDC
jgi:hypothetical protein